MSMGLLLSLEASITTGFVEQDRATALKNSIQTLSAWSNCELAWEVERQCSGFYYHSLWVLPLLLRSFVKTSEQTSCWWAYGEPDVVGREILLLSNVKRKAPVLRSLPHLGKLTSSTAFTHPWLMGWQLLTMLWLTLWPLSCPLLNVYLDLRTLEMSSQWGRAVWGQELWGNYFSAVPRRGVGL